MSVIARSALSEALLHFAEVESTRTHFEVLGLEAIQVLKNALSSRSRTALFFELLKTGSDHDLFFLRLNFAENLREDIFRFFFSENTYALCPWSLASRESVLGKSVLGFGLEFFLCPWPQTLCSRLHL